MRLQKLTSLEVEKIVSEYKEVIKIIAHLKGILESKKQRMDIIKDELLNIQDQYGDKDSQRLFLLILTFLWKI